MGRDGDDRIKHHLGKPTALPWVCCLIVHLLGVNRMPAESPRPPTRTDFGVVAFLIAAFIAGLELLDTVGRGLLSPSPKQRLSNFIFDYGFLITILCLVFSLIGLFKGGTNRFVSILAIVLLLLPWPLMFSLK
jgi:hypothetical protein